MGKSKIERMRQRLAEAQRDVEYATARADVAERECDKLSTLLEEERKLVQRVIVEKEDEAQVAKRQIEEIGQELADARKDAEDATARADVAERLLKNMEDNVKLLKMQRQVIKESASRRDEGKALQLAKALDAFVIAESECANLKRMLIEEGKTVQKLIIEKDDAVKEAKREIEKMGQELAYARKEAENARKGDANIAKDQWNKVKKEVKEKEEVIKFLMLDIQEKRQVTVRQVEEIRQELKEARNDAAIAQNECIKAKEDLQEKLELIHMLELECQETSERAVRQVEEKELELADALNAVTSASSSSSVAQDCVICLTNEKDMAFGCGHMTCEECGVMLSTCPLCREDITNRIKLFPG